jgi:hypothetical protein
MTNFGREQLPSWMKLSASTMGLCKHKQVLGNIPLWHLMALL